MAKSYMDRVSVTNKGGDSYGTTTNKAGGGKLKKVAKKRTATTSSGKSNNVGAGKRRVAKSIRVGGVTTPLTSKTPNNKIETKHKY